MQAWNAHVVFNGLWRRRLLKQLAPEGSYTRRVLDTRSRLGDFLDDPDVGDVEKSKYRLILLLLISSME